MRFESENRSHVLKTRVGQERRGKGKRKGVLEWAKNSKQSKRASTAFAGKLGSTKTHFVGFSRKQDKKSFFTCEREAGRECANREAAREIGKSQVCVACCSLFVEYVPNALLSVQKKTILVLFTFFVTG